MENNDIIDHLRDMAEKESSPSDMLKFLTVELSMTDQVDIMRLFSTAMNVTLGEVTAIAAWWHEGERELSDTDIDAYMAPVVKDFQNSLSK